MTINLGPISGVTAHYTTDDGIRSVPRTLCERGGGSLAIGVLHTYMTDPSKVTCTDCIEWLHA